MPPTMETTAIKNVTPIVTPITLKKLFSFCTRMVSKAMRTAWKKLMRRERGEGGEATRRGALVSLSRPRYTAGLRPKLQLLQPLQLDDFRLAQTRRHDAQPGHECF